MCVAQRTGSVQHTLVVDSRLGLPAPFLVEAEGAPPEENLFP